MQNALVLQHLLRGLHEAVDNPCWFETEGVCLFSLPFPFFLPKPGRIRNIFSFSIYEMSKGNENQVSPMVRILFPELANP